MIVDDSCRLCGECRAIGLDLCVRCDRRHGNARPVCERCKRIGCDGAYDDGVCSLTPFLEALKVVEKRLREQKHVAEGADNCVWCHVLKAITDPIPCNHREPRAADDDELQQRVAAARRKWIMQALVRYAGGHMTLGETIDEVCELAGLPARRGKPRGAEPEQNDADSNLCCQYYPSTEEG